MDGRDRPKMADNKTGIRFVRVPGTSDEHLETLDVDELILDWSQLLGDIVWSLSLPAIIISAKRIL